DASTADEAAGFTYAFDWGDGTQSLSGPAEFSASHVYAATGTFTVKVTAADKDQLAGPPASRKITIKAAEVQGDTLVVGGTTGKDAIVIKAADPFGDLTAVVNKVTVGTFRP